MSEQIPGPISHTRQSEIPLHDASVEAEVERRVVARTMEIARALRLKDEYLANMTHELRTPLTSILSMAQALQMNLFSDLTDDQRTAVEIILESGQHLLAVINNMLDLAKIEAGKMELHVELLDLADCCEMVMRMITHTATRKDLRVTLRVDEPAQPIYADPVRLTQMLVNLLSNAVEYTPSNGEIGLDVTADPEARVISFVVWDTGVGIPAEKLPLLFQPFTQLDARPPHEWTGTGLGLSLVRRIAELHGGCVRVTSAVGEGTRFTILLPWVQTEAEAEPLVAGPEADLPDQAATILVVDDNALSSTQLRAQLAALGYRVAAARNGAEGLERALALHPALILLDMRLPGFDSFQVTHGLRQHPVTASIPIIALTALVMPGDRERCLEAGMADYLIKPVATAALRETLERYLGTKGFQVSGFGFQDPTCLTSSTPET